MESEVLSLERSPPIWRWVMGFLLVGMAWGLTTPFMARAAKIRDEKPLMPRPFLSNPENSWLSRKAWSIVYGVIDLLRNPAYALPLLLNVTGSVWFFLLIGQAVLGEWWAEGKVISQSMYQQTSSNVQDAKSMQSSSSGMWGLTKNEQVKASKVVFEHLLKDVRPECWSDSIQYPTVVELLVVLFSATANSFWKFDIPLTIT
nr:hypothetical protein CFP56_21164 [Quercus suber]